MKIAIIRLSALGDIIHSMIALQFIKKKYPECQIDWVVEQGFFEILNHNPDINNLLTVHLKSLKHNKTALFGEINKVRHYAKQNYDLVIDAQGLIKSAMTARLLGKKTAGFDKDSVREKAAAWFYDIKLNCAYDKNTIDRNAFILSEPLGFNISSNDILNKQAFLFYKNEDTVIYDYLRKDQKNIIFVIGSTWESRNYPIEKFINIANALKQNCLIIWGNESEKQKAEFMAGQSHYIQVMPKLDLNSLKALIAHADLLIGNDTGPTHIAWGLNRPSITLFGCTPISRVYQTDINKVLKSASIVNPFKLNKQDFSIQEIDEHEVIQLAELLLR
ncbi:heptosyltransferase I [Patescibacteria group bacterium]|nr:heptosyltransferase I [Patescibacteria group bacterium]